MHSGSLYDEEVEVTRTELVDVLLKARESVFTCSFHKKVTPEFVSDLLNGVTSDSDLTSRRKELAKSICMGQEVSMTCFLLSTEEKLGRSMVIDLSAPYGKNFRQIDHRTIESMILEN